MCFGSNILVTLIDKVKVGLHGMSLVFPKSCISRIRLRTILVHKHHADLNLQSEVTVLGGPGKESDEFECW